MPAITAATSVAARMWIFILDISAGSCGHDDGGVRRPQVGELDKQIAVGRYLLSRHPPVREDSQENITDVVGECPAIARESRWASGVIGEHVRQQCPCQPPRFFRGIPTRVLKRVREDGEETRIFRRLTRKIGIPLLANKERNLEGQR